MTELVYHRGIAKHPETGRYHVQVMVNGKRVRRVMPTKRAAEALVASLKHRKVARQLGMVDATLPNLGELTASYLATCNERGLAPKTLEHYAWVTQTLERVLGSTAHPRFTNADIAELVRVRRAEGVAASTIAAEIRFLAKLIRQTIGPAHLTFAITSI